MANIKNEPQYWLFVLHMSKILSEDDQIGIRNEILDTPYSDEMDDGRFFGYQEYVNYKQLIEMLTDKDAEFAEQNNVNVYELITKGYIPAKKDADDIYRIKKTDVIKFVHETERIAQFIIHDLCSPSPRKFPSFRPSNDAYRPFQNESH